MSSKNGYSCLEHQNPINFPDTIAMYVMIQIRRLMLSRDLLAGEVLDVCLGPVQRICQYMDPQQMPSPLSPHGVRSKGRGIQKSGNGKWYLHVTHSDHTDSLPNA